MREVLGQRLGSQGDDCRESRVKLWKRPAAELAELSQATESLQNIRGEEEASWV